MIEFVPAEHDDVAFLSLAQRIINGAIAELRMREVFLVHVDNWFDHKWLGWWSRKDEELRVPTFTPNRVLSEKHFLWTAETSAWQSIALQGVGMKVRPLPAPLKLSSSSYAKNTGTTSFVKGAPCSLETLN